MIKYTEQDSHYRHLEQMEVEELLKNINKEDISVAHAVNKAMPQITALVKKTVELLKNGGRLFYIGAGTSGRLGILDASECPPTFGVSPDLVVGIIAGGDKAIRKAVEGAEDDREQAILDLQAYGTDRKDMVIGIAASGTTPYVIGGLKACREQNISTACITCNPGSPVTEHADYPVEVLTGPEFVTGSTRMKAGTAQKMVLNMITTATMISLGYVKDNKMVDMQMSNQKLKERGALIIANQLNIDFDTAKELLMKYGSVRAALESYEG